MNKVTTTVWSGNAADTIIHTLHATAENAAELADLTAAATTLGARSAAKTVTLVGNTLVVELTL
jgi:hypothetical protein